MCCEPQEVVFVDDDVGIDERDVRGGHHRQPGIAGTTGTDVRVEPHEFHVAHRQRRGGAVVDRDGPTLSGVEQRQVATGRHDHGEQPAVARLQFDHRMDRSGVE